MSFCLSFFENIILKIIDLVVKAGSVLFKKHEKKLRDEIYTSVYKDLNWTERKVYILTPERVLRLLANTNSINPDFIFFDEIYKIDEDVESSEDDIESNNSNRYKYGRSGGDRTIEFRLRDYKSNRKYFISAIRMMKYIGTLSNNRDDNVRVFKRELRRFLNGKSSNIRELSNSRKVSDACEYIDTFRNGAAHPDPSDRPENYWSEHIGECKTKTEEVLRYFLTNVGNA